MLQEEASCRRAHCHDQIETAPREKSAQVVNERSVVLRPPQSVHFEVRLHKDRSELATALELLSEPPRDGLPRRKVRPKRVHEEDAPRLGSGRFKHRN